MSVKVSEGITHDHRELEEYKNNILSAKDNDDKVKWQNQFTWELARHSIAEELVVYPAMEKYVPGGKDMAEKDRDEHQTVRNTSYHSILFPRGPIHAGGASLSLQKVLTRTLFLAI